ncbi:MAG: Holliday junction branch migration protein RuvA [Bdellovibrionales bacterium]|nr:Holliday junction branch migration protein RuvA [Bdellovibrionales bacterium]
MIGFLSGEVLFSDGSECIIQTSTGIGYQVYYNKVLVEGTLAAIYVAHIIKEDSETLFGFHSLRSKKLFEMLLTVKGIGPKSAYNLLANIGVNEIINAVNLEAKATLTKVPGLGTKGAAQIILDLAGKIDRVKMYSDSTKVIRGGLAPVTKSAHVIEEAPYIEVEVSTASVNQHEILNDTLMACKELGFREEKIIPIAQKILGANLITKPEQLIHLVLKEL